MSMALCLIFTLSLAGHTSTHTPQPVQSSGATCTVTFQPGYSLPRQSADWNWRALGHRAGSKAFMRIVAWGQPSEQSPHWMQIFASQTGMSWAMLRFSYCVVPVGNVPSTGRALTGRSSPRLAIIMPSTSLTNAGAVAGTGGTMCELEVTLAGHLTSWSAARAASTAA